MLVDSRLREPLKSRTPRDKMETGRGPYVAIGETGTVNFWCGFRGIETFEGSCPKLSPNQRSDVEGAEKSPIVDPGSVSPRLGREGVSDKSEIRIPTKEDPPPPPGVFLNQGFNAGTRPRSRAVFRKIENPRAGESKGAPCARGGLEAEEAGGGRDERRVPFLVDLNVTPF